MTDTVDPSAGTTYNGSRRHVVADWWRGQSTGVRVGLISLLSAIIVAIIGGAAVIIAALISRPPAAEPVPLTAPSLTVTTLSKGGTNPVDVTSATTAGVAVAGEVHGTLRDGQAVFLLWRQYDGEPSKNVSAGTVYSGPPCVVADHEFTCDAPWLGSRPDSGISLIWVGIADSAATRSLTLSYAQQREPGDEGGGPQQEPNGFTVEGMFRLHWPQS